MTTLHTFPTHSLGNIKSTAMGFGCMSLTPGFYGENVDEAESEKTLRAALDSGVNLLNTADFYTSMKSGETYQNLKLIGKVLKDYDRSKIVLVMKWGFWVEGGPKPYDNSPAACKKRVDDALKHLGTDYIDILVWRLAPYPDIHNTSVEEGAKGMKGVLESGKVKAIGMSEFPAEDIRKVNAIVPVSAVELEWSLFTRDAEKEIIPTAREIGAGILAYSPLGRGILTGKYDYDKLEPSDFRQGLKRAKGDILESNLKLVRRIEELAEKKGCTSGQLAIAWVLAQGNDVVPIPGTKRVKYLEENLKAVNIKLSPEEIKELHDIVPESAVSGDRY